MTVKYYEYFRFEDYDDNKLVGIRMRISTLLNKNIFDETVSLRKRIKIMSADLSTEQKEIFRILAIYFWKKSRNRLYKLHVKFVKHPQK